MADFVELPDYESTTNRPPPPSGLIARADDRPLQFEPGAAWRYSNSGYAVLGYLIGQVSGHPYRAFIEENIFDVLHMDDSGYDPRQEVIATGYVGTGDQ
jgi:CubicO group peptidase (beta-lactamase class C family)